jgi:hypothetical protein
MPTVPPSWHPDPYGRYEQRYWDGSRWTDQVTTDGRQSVDPLGATTSVPFSTPASAWGTPQRPGEPPPGYVPYGQVPVSGPPPRSGLLVTAGVLSLVIGGFTALFAIGAAFGAASTPEDDWLDLRAVFFVIAAMFAGIATVFITAGVGGCKRRRWGKVMMIVVYSIIVLIGLASLSDSDAAGAGLFFLVIGGAGLGLSIAGRPAERR